jgi:hypothetical protein
MKNEILSFALLALGMQTQRIGPNTFVAGIKTVLYRDHDDEKQILIAMDTCDDSDCLTIRAPLLVKLTGRPCSAQNAAIVTALKIAGGYELGRLEINQEADNAYIGFYHFLFDWNPKKLVSVLTQIKLLAELRCEEIKRALLTEQVRVSSPEEVAEGYARLVSELEDEGIRR